MFPVVEGFESVGLPRSPLPASVPVLSAQTLPLPSLGSTPGAGFTQPQSLLSVYGEPQQGQGIRRQATGGRSFAEPVASEMAAATFMTVRSW